ncbi:MAG: hypothetical protein R3E89_01895 [Thiolinea sp.]
MKPEQQRPGGPVTASRHWTVLASWSARRQDDPLVQALSVEARQRLLGLLQLRLENLRLLLLQGQDGLYHRQLALLRDT